MTNKPARKPIAPDLRRKILDELHAAIARIEVKYGVSVRHNVDSITRIARGK